MRQQTTSFIRSTSRVFGGLIAGALLVAACGTDDDTSAGNTSVPSAGTEISVATSPSLSPETAEPTTAEPTAAEASTNAPAPVGTEAAPSTEAPTVAPLADGHFGDKVLPILQQNCASCHTAGGPGSTHLKLETAADAKNEARFIGLAVESRYMPPWPAGDGGVAFHNDRRLSTEQIQAVVDWVKADGALDVDASTPITPTKVTAPSIERDIAMVGKPYKGSTADVDDYHCQIYDPALTTTSFLQGMQFEPDQTEVVHHALLFTAQAGTLKGAQEADAASPDAPGFPCPCCICRKRH